MTSERYAALSEPFRRNPVLLTLLKLCNLLFTGVGYVTYPVMVGCLLWQRDWGVVPCVLIPGISFVLLSAIRKKINAGRPYEVLNIRPLLHKDTKGNSFPSRHVFSIFVIAGSWYGICVPAGILVTLCGLGLAAVRVLGGVHFPRDVAVGGIVGILCGLLTSLCYGLM